MTEDNYTRLNLYEKNKEARQANPCLNPRCDNFVDIHNNYDLCNKCFDMLVDYFGSEHSIFDYGTKPTTRRMTTSELKKMLRKVENNKRSLKNQRWCISNSQKRWR